MLEDTVPAPLTPTAVSPRPGAGGGPGAPPRGTLIDRFVVLEPLGEGGMGVVVAAFDARLERKVALKLVKPAHGSGPEGEGLESARGRLQREAQALAKLSHPNVVTLYEVGEYGDRLFLAMEYVEGETARRWLEASPRSWRETLEVYLQAGQGLAAAHRAGLVHRDVKPENVLVGKDGRVRVGDFGLVARPHGAPLADASRLSPAGLQTVTGAFIGTPLYAAPEQLRGEPVTERGDQFSFCVALWEALYGARPFAGSTVPELLAAIESRALVQPPKSSGGPVPSWLRAALLEGLAPRAEDRHPSMEALLRALAQDPAPVRRRRFALAAGALVLLAGLFGAWRLREATRPSCRPRPEELAGLWDEGVRGHLAKAFEATGRPNATGAFRVFSAGLERYASDWVAQRAEACEATHVRGAQSEGLLDLRMRCLDRRKQQLAALLSLYAGPLDAPLVNAALDAPLKLAPLTDCADAERLSAPVPLPKEPQRRAAIAQLESRLDTARAQVAAGRAKVALESLEPVVKQAREVGHLPLLGQALLALGKAQVDTAQHVPAVDTLLEAAEAAARSHDDATLVPALIALTVDIGRLQQKTEIGLGMARVVDLAILRTGENPLTRAELMAISAEMLDLLGRSREGEQRAREAIALLTQHRQGDTLTMAMALSALGSSLTTQLRLDEARAAHEASLAVAKKLLPAEHPALAARLNGLGIVARRSQDDEAARRYYQASLALKEAVLGHGHPSTVNTLQNLGGLAADEGRYDEAQRLFREGAQLRTAAFGPSHRDVGQSRANLGAALVAAGALDEGEAELERALALQEKALGLEHPELVDTLQGLAEAARLRGRVEAVRALYGRALALQEKASGAKSLPVARLWARSGQAHWALGRHAEAQRAFAAAQEILDQNEDPLARRMVLLGLGRLAARAGRDGEAQALFERGLALPGGAAGLEAAALRFELGRLLRRRSEAPERAKALLGDARAALRERQGVDDRRLLAEVEALEARGGGPEGAAKGAGAR